MNPEESGDQTLNESIRQVMPTLPPPVRDYLKSGKYSAVAAVLMQQYKLHVDQAGILERELLLLIMGLSSPQDFVDHLTNEAYLPSDIVRLIGEEVNRQIFIPLRDEMRTQSTARANTTAPTAPAPTARPVPPPPSYAPPAPPPPAAHPLPPPDQIYTPPPPPARVPPAPAPIAHPPAGRGIALPPAAPQAGAQAGAGRFGSPAAPQAPAAPAAPTAPPMVAPSAPLPPRTIMPGASAPVFFKPMPMPTPRASQPPAPPPNLPTGPAPEPPSSLPPLAKPLSGERPLASDSTGETPHTRYPVDPYREPVE